MRCLTLLMVLMLSLVTTTAVAEVAGEDPEEEREPAGWEYGLLVGFGVHTQGLDGSGGPVAADPSAQFPGPPPQDLCCEQALDIDGDPIVDPNTGLPVPVLYDAGRINSSTGLPDGPPVPPFVDPDTGQIVYDPETGLPVPTLVDFDNLDPATGLPSPILDADGNPQPAPVNSAYPVSPVTGQLVPRGVWNSLDLVRSGTAMAGGNSATTPFLSVATRIYFPEDFLGDSAFIPRLVLNLGADFPLDNKFRASAYQRSFDAISYAGPSAEVCPQSVQADPADEGIEETCSYSGRTFVDVLANWHAGVEADFKLPYDEGRYHISPGFGYFGQAFESEGKFRLTQSANLATDSITNFEGSSDTEILHGLYGSIGLGVDVWEDGGFTSRLSVNGRAAYLLSDRETTYSSPANANAPINFNQFEFQARPSSWVFTIYAGVEVRFDPSFGR